MFREHGRKTQEIFIRTGYLFKMSSCLWFMAYGVGGVSILYSRVDSKGSSVFSFFKCESGCVHMEFM